MYTVTKRFRFYKVRDLILQLCKGWNYRKQKNMNRIIEYRTTVFLHIQTRFIYEI